MENGLTVLRFIVEHLAMMHGWLVDTDIRVFGFYLEPSMFSIHVSKQYNVSKDCVVSGFRLHRSCMDGMFFNLSWEVKDLYSKCDNKKLGLKTERSISTYGT